MKAILLGAAIGGAVAAQDDWSNPERAWAKIIISALVTIGICSLLGLDRTSPPQEPPPPSPLAIP